MSAALDEAGPGGEAAADGRIQGALLGGDSDFLGVDHSLDGVFEVDGVGVLAALLLQQV